jgi:hypothetical protein
LKRSKTKRMLVPNRRSKEEKEEKEEEEEDKNR